jgi:hypothetical protein
MDGTVQLWRGEELLRLGRGEAVEVRWGDGAVSALEFCPFEDQGELLAR